jgi:hypothetical protein
MGRQACEGTGKSSKIPCNHGAVFFLSGESLDWSFKKAIVAWQPSEVRVKSKRQWPVFILFTAEEEEAQEEVAVVHIDGGGGGGGGSRVNQPAPTS